jgi:hypothetical protein
MGTWAGAEAIALPVVPDVGLCLLALAAPRPVLKLFLVVIGGALAGTLLLAILAIAAPETIRAMLLALPGIDASTLAEVDLALAGNGIAGFAQVGPGPPLKAYTVQWLGQGGDLPGLVVGAIINRLTRIGPVVMVAALIGWGLRAWMRQRERLILVAYAVAWIVFYAAYWAGAEAQT